MRPESTTLGVDLQIGLDGISIDLSLGPEIARQLRNSTGGQEETLVNLPVFRTQRGRADISVISVDSAWLGVHSVRSINGTNIGLYNLVGVTATVKTNSKK